MYNDIVKLGPVVIHGYGLMIGLGILFAFITADLRARKRSLDNDVLYGLGFAGLIGGIAGAKLLYCITELGDFLENPLKILSGNGFAVYGGIIGGLLTALAYSRWKKVKFINYFDLAAPSIALAQGFGRIGCFLAGCCYGRETDSVIGIVFQNSSYAPNGVRLLPTQLFSSAGDFLIAAILLLYARRSRPEGSVGASYVILYGIGRFLIEFFRNDYRGSIGILSTSQFLSLFVLAAVILILLLKSLPKRKKSQTVNENNDAGK